MKRLPFYPVLFQHGLDAYRTGKATTAEQAKVLNPYRLFGEVEEHAKGVSWNKGWNTAKRAADEAR